MTKKLKHRTHNLTVDLGTPELRLKKYLVSREMEGSDNILGVLRCQGMIDEGMYDAGLFIQESHHQYSLNFTDNYWIGGSSLSRFDKVTSSAYHSDGETPNKRQMYVYERWKKTEQFLRDLGKKPYKSVMKITLNHSPYESPSREDLKHGCYALLSLHNWLKEGKRVRLKKN